MAQHYSPERKAALLAKLLPPHNLSVITVARQEGAGKTTLHKWLAEIRREENGMPHKAIHPNKWTAEDRFAAVVETATLSEEDLAAYCRRKGLYQAQIAQWKQAFIQSPAPQNTGPHRQPQNEIRQLKRELARKEKALASLASAAGRSSP